MLTGVGLKVLSTLIFSFMMALMKANIEYPLGEIVFFRSAPALLVLFVWLLARGEFPGALKTSWLSGHLVRAISGSGSMFMMFATYYFLPLADTSAVLYTGPLMIVLLSWLVLGERIGFSRLCAVVLGFCGVLVMLAEHLGAGHGLSSRGAVGVMCGLLGAFFVAIAMIQTRRLTRTEHTGAIVFYFQSVAALAGLSFCMLGWLWPASAPSADFMRAQAWIWPSPRDGGLMFVAGLCGGLGQILMTKAYSFADASIIASFEYVSMIWVVTLGYVFFNELPSIYVVIGACVVAAAGVLLILGERARAPAVRKLA